MPLCTYLFEGGHFCLCKMYNNFSVIVYYMRKKHWKRTIREWLVCPVCTRHLVTSYWIRLWWYSSRLFHSRTEHCLAMQLYTMNIVQADASQIGRCAPMNTSYCVYHAQDVTWNSAIYKCHDYGYHDYRHTVLTTGPWKQTPERLAISVKGRFPVDRKQHQNLKILYFWSKKFANIHLHQSMERNAVFS